MTVTADAPLAATAPRHGRDPLLGRLLFGAAALVFVLPWPHQVLSGVGTTDHSTLDSAGYSRSITVTAQGAPRPKQGDDILGSLTKLQRAASDNKVAADRRLLCLVLGLPGAYVLGRSRKAVQGA